MLNHCNMLKTIVVAVMVGVMVGILTTPAVAYPEPKIVTGSWALDFTHGTPRSIEVAAAAGKPSSLYWYMTYSVQNNTDQDRLFVPDVWLMTDQGDLLQANRRVPSSVFKSIKSKQGNPLMESPVDVVGRILQGEDNARDGVVIWKVPVKDVNHVAIFVGGLSGETHEVTDPKTGKTRLLRKTLMLTYDTPGDKKHQALKEFNAKSESWIVR